RADPQRTAADHGGLAGRDAELAGGDLRECRLQALPLRWHAGEDGDASSRIGADGRALERAHAGQLDVARYAEPEPPALVAGAPTFLRQALVARHLQRVAEDGWGG